MKNKTIQVVKNNNFGEGVTETQKGKVICSMEVWNRLEQMDNQIRTLSKVLENEIERNQKSDEKIAKILRKQAELNRQFVEVN